MKKMLSLLLVAHLTSTYAFSQSNCNDNFQTVTDRGNTTSPGKEIDIFAPDGVTYTYIGGGVNTARIGGWKHLVGPVDLSLNPVGGNVGIGSYTPAYKLDVNGNARIEDILHANRTGGNIRLKVDGSEELDGALFTASDGTIYLSNWKNNRGLCIKSDGNSFLRGGGLGIGTSNPVTPLHVLGGSVMSGAWNKTATLQATYPVQLFNSNGAKWAGMGYDFSSGLYFWVNAPGEDVSGTGNLAMRIDNSGRIGIGTSIMGDYRLAVEGVIGARKIKVTQQAWADYVFDSSYQLPSLSHVETFIKENKHLPEVPSAAEVKKDGLDLGDNQAILLKKIEELTLYIIQQNKKVEQMEKRLQELETKQ